LTVSKATLLRRKLPVGAVDDYEKAYGQALEVVAELETQVTQLNRLLDWCSPRMKDEICKGTLANMRIDPTQIPVPDKKKVPPKPRQKPIPEEDSFSALDQREAAPLAGSIPDDVAEYLIFTSEEEMNWIGDNFERMTWLRNKGFFVLVGADNRVGLPPRLSPLGRSVVEVLRKRRL
jgi:hypothetical protein